MLIPFTVPRVPELDALSPEDRASVLKAYITSDDARGIVKRMKGIMFVGLGFAVLGLVTPVITDAAPSGREMVKAITVGCWLTAAVALPAAILFYRRASQRLIRSLVNKEIRRRS